ncbi:MAG: N-acetylmuramoyl-L-alanine amidase [Bacteroidota bacterium]
MWQKIIEFFRRLFGRSEPAPKPRLETPPETPLPEPDAEVAQDGSEITEDTTVLVTMEDDPQIMISEPEPNTGVEEPAPEPDEEDTEPTEVGPSQPPHKARFLWCLDNGHGKQTKGKRSPKLPDGRQLLEYEFNRDIVKRIMQSLDEKGVQYFNVVPEVDIDNFLAGRVGRANRKQSELPKLYLSIHANAAPAPSGKWSAPHISGIETWYFHNSRKGRKLAAIFQKHLIEVTDWTNRHIKSRPKNQFYVLQHTSMPAVLTENGFYNNKAQCLELLKHNVRQKIADAHVASIMEIEKNGI